MTNTKSVTAEVEVGPQRALERALSELTRESVPGIAVALVPESGEIEGLGVGLARLDHPAPMTPNTVGNLFSTTKLATATAVMQLREKGLVELDRPIADFLPDARLGDGDEHRVTVRHLLSHTSGLPDPAPILWIHLSGHTGPTLASFTTQELGRHGRLRFPPGTHSSYSSLGYLLLGCLIERIAGTTFEAYITEHVLRPLRMTRTSFAYPPPSVEDVARGHERALSAMGLAARVLYRPYIAGSFSGFLEYRPFLVNGASYGGLVGSAYDLARFVAAFVRAGELDGNRLLEPGSVAEMLTPTVGPDGHPVRPARGSRHPGTPGLGWHIREMDGVRHAYHLGGGGGYFSQARVYPDLGTGIAVIGNVTSWNVDSVAAFGGPREGAK